MKKLYWLNGELLKYIEGLSDIKELKVATAFFSFYGLEILKNIIERNKLHKIDVQVYLSVDFTNTEPVLLLKELITIANVKIVNDTKFHAKVYYFNKENDDLILFGSSNLTKGGMEDNLEFNMATNEINKEQIKAFFYNCEKSSIPVDDNIIEYYKDSEFERKEMVKIQKILTKKLSTSYNDPFDVNTYDIHEFFFKYIDYETLFPKNIKRSDQIIKNRRISIKEKLLQIDKLVHKDLSTINLDHHWVQAHITSTIELKDFNQNQITWIGVRYAPKSKINTIRSLKISSDGYGFPKYACLQFSIYEKEFNISLFHAVKNNAVDRTYLHKQIVNKSFAAKLIDTLDKLKGYGFIWNIPNSRQDGKEKYFYIDNEDLESFIDFYKNNDDDGTESFLSLSITPDDIRIKDAESIKQLVLRYFNILLPLLDLVSKKW